MKNINQELQRSLSEQIKDILAKANAQGINEDIVFDIECLQNDVETANEEIESAHGENNREVVVFLDSHAYRGRGHHKAFVKTPALMEYLEGQVDVPSEVLIDQLSTYHGFSASKRDKVKEQLDTLPTRNHVTGYRIDHENLSVRPRMLFDFGYDVLFHEEKDTGEVYCFGIKHGEYFFVASDNVIDIRANQRF